MTPTLMAESRLPDLPMVWPSERLPAPSAAIPGGYLGRACLEAGLGPVRTLVVREWPHRDRHWGLFVDHVVPGGAFLMVHADTGQAVAAGLALDCYDSEYDG